MPTSKAHTITDIVMPTGINDMIYASQDPLSSPELLAQIYNNFCEQEDTQGKYPDYVYDLAGNPSLPPLIFSALFDQMNSRGSDADRGVYSLPNELSCFFANPLTTFDQVLSIARCFNEKNHFVSPLVLNQCDTVIEIFDKLVVHSVVNHSFFFAKLLSSSMVSGEDFRSRVRNTASNLLDGLIVCSDARFIPDEANYSFAKNFIDCGRFDDEERAEGIVVNPNAEVPFLVDFIEFAAGRSHIEEIVYENLRCPIELSAHFHLDNLDKYIWRPTYLLALQSKVDGYLMGLDAGGPWEELPLSWKLKMIVG